MMATTPTNPAFGREKYSKAKVRATKPVSFSVKGLRQILKPNNLTVGRYGHRYRCRWAKPVI